VLADARATTVAHLQAVAFVVDELAWRLRASRTIEERTATLQLLERLAALGAAGPKAAGRLRRELLRPTLRALWSVPLASFDPAANRFRELAFSYQ
jgi:hypothetical protein